VHAARPASATRLPKRAKPGERAAGKTQRRRQTAPPLSKNLTLSAATTRAGAAGTHK